MMELIARAAVECEIENIPSDISKMLFSQKMARNRRKAEQRATPFCQHTLVLKNLSKRANQTFIRLDFVYFCFHASGHNFRPTPY